MSDALSDQAIATQVNDGLKHCVISCAQSATEASNPSVRQALSDISADGIRRQAKLVQLMETKGWYVPTHANPSDIEQLKPQLQAVAQPQQAKPQGVTPRS